MTLSILIVNWNSKNFVKECLASLRRACSGLHVQIIVVDGGSFDGCAEMLAESYPEVLFLQAGQNIGFGASNNLGATKATGDALLLLNPDTEVHESALTVLLEELERLPDPGVLCPKLLNTDGSLQTSCVRALPTPLNRALDSELFRRLMPNSRLWGVAEAFRAVNSVEVEAVSGACMLMHTSVFRRVGGFSPQFFMYGEDLDLCAKVRRIGLRNFHVPNALVTHHGKGSSGTQVSQFATVMMRQGGEIYMLLNHGRLTAISYRLLQALSALVRLVIALGASVAVRGARRASALASAKKWWFVFKWAVGASSIQPPVVANESSRSYSVSPV